MNNIICATRGGEGSRAVQYAAIERAKAIGGDITFLFVIDMGLVGEIDDSLRAAIRAELFWMGSTLLRIAGRRALTAEVNAELIIREGKIRDEICALVSSQGASLLLLGAPRTSSAIFESDEIEGFAKSLSETTGVMVEIIRPPDQSESGE